VHLERLYAGIDLAETLSCRLGLPIRRVTRETVTLDDGTLEGLTIDLRAPRWQDVKPLVWW
jgi:hypothetical protein